MRWGSLLEPVLASEYAREKGVSLKLFDKDSEPLWHEHGIVYAHLDGAVEDEAGGSWIGAWEGKTAGDDWDWQRGVPDYYEVQCRTYLEVTQLPWIDVSVLFPRADFRTYRIEADPPYDRAIVDLCRRFYNEHIVPRIPPPADDSRGLNAHIARAYPRPTIPEPMVAPPEADAIARRLLEIAASKSGLDAEQKVLKNQLKLLMGSYPAMEGPGWSVTWNNNQDSTEVAWPHVASAYREIAEGLASAISEELQPDFDAIESLYTTTKPGSRPFVIRSTE